MRWVRSLLARIEGLFTKGRRERELQEEFASHFELHIAENVRAGMTPEQARRDAILHFGCIESAKDDYREAGTLTWIENTWLDLRFGIRQLLKNPGFSVTTISILALGIGASTAIFSAVNPILFEPLPYPDARRIMKVSDFGNGGSPVRVTFGTYREVLERSRSFESLAVMKPWLPVLTGTGQPEKFIGQRVSAAYFRVLGIAPRIGTGFNEKQDEPQGPNVVVLSDRLWRRRFAGDTKIVGSTIKLDDALYTVVGVMPKDFENVPAASAELWAPLQYDKSLLPDSREWGHHLEMIGRLRPGVSVEQARNELNDVARHPISQFQRPAYASLDSGLMLDSLQADVTRGVRSALLAVLGAVFLLLVISCVNVTNLILARSAQRSGELSMRVALGAARARILRQLLTESLLLSALGGVVGYGVALVGVTALKALSPPGLPRLHAIAVNQTALVFAFGITLLVGILVGLIPSFHLVRGETRIGLRVETGRTTNRHQVIRRGLVIAEVSLALVLLISSGLLLRSLQRLFAIDPGFNASHTLTLKLQAAGDRFRDRDVCDRYFQQVLARIRGVPGVVSAGSTSQLPLSGDLEDGYGVHFEPDPNENRGALRYAVTAGYFQSMGIPIERGRFLDDHDSSNAPFVALISESLANSKFHGEDPLGKRLGIGPSDSPWYTIVGVVGNVRQTSLALSESDAVYIPSEQWRMFSDNVRWISIRVQGDPRSLVTSVKNAVWSVDKDEPIVRIATMNDLLLNSADQRRFVLILFEGFAFAALMLAATGIYGVVSGGVTERTREIGVRIALGATPSKIVSLIVNQAMAMTGIGVVFGIAGAVMASQVLISMLYGVSRVDPLTYGGVIALLVAVAVLACWIPAWRAAQVDPSITLRVE